MKSIVSWVLAVSLLATLSAFGETPSVQKVAGKYTGSFAGGNAVFDVQLNGNYTFTFLATNLTTVAREFVERFGIRGGRIFDAKGTWDIVGGKVRFWCLPSPFDFQRQG